MTHTNLVLGGNWHADEWPDYVSVEHDDGRDRGAVKYVPELACRIVYDNVHQDYYCSACGEYFDTGMYEARDPDDGFLHKDFQYCPNCGARVKED